MSAVTVREVLARSTSYLADRGVERPRLDAERLVAHTLGVDRIALYTNPERVLDEAQVTVCRELIVRRRGTRSRCSTCSASGGSAV